MTEDKFVQQKDQRAAQDAFFINSLRCQVANLQCEMRAREREHKEESERQLMEIHQQYRVKLFVQDQENYILHRQVDDLHGQLDYTCTQLETTRNQLEITGFELFHSIQPIRTMEHHQQRPTSDIPGTFTHHQNQQPVLPQVAPSSRPVCLACVGHPTLKSTCDGSRRCNNCSNRYGAGCRCNYPRCAVVADWSRSSWTTFENVDQKRGDTSR